MLTTYRRHRKDCEHRSAGRDYRRCRCPIWVDGNLSGVEIRQTLHLRDWEKAQQKIREWEAEGIPVGKVEIATIEQAMEAFKCDAEARGLQESTLKKYRVLFKQLRSFAVSQGLSAVKQLDDLKLMRKFRESWADKGISAGKKLERLRAFLRFAQENGWIKENPARHIKRPKVTNPPTMPFTQEEMMAMLTACNKLHEQFGGGGSASRLRAFLLLIRYSGLRIGDTATCEVERISQNRLRLYTAKTGVAVNVKLPIFVVDALNAMPKVSPRYFFWTGHGKKDTAAGNWRRALRRLFTLAGIKGGHPHRFRDTFAVELLLAGVPIEHVSTLLGHSGIRVTERHYSPWVQARQQQLEAHLERSWALDSVALAATKGTPEVHGREEAVN